MEAITEKRIILKERIKDLERQMKNHLSSRSKAKGRNDSEKFDFEQGCVTECENRIKKATEELKSL